VCFVWLCIPVGVVHCVLCFVLCVCSLCLRCVFLFGCAGLCVVRGCDVRLACGCIYLYLYEHVYIRIHIYMCIYVNESAFFRFDFFVCVSVLLRYFNLLVYSYKHMYF